MSLKRRNSAILLLLFFIAAIHIFLGIIKAQAAEKTVLKIQQEKEKITAPSMKPSEEKEAREVAADDSKEKDIGKGSYTYDPTNKVDPFKSFIVLKKEIEEREKKAKPRTYLETLDISQLTISAIVLSDKESWALVRDSKGEGHVIKVGTAIGNRRGRVIKILAKEVVVREYYTDIRGREIVRDISMRLPLVD